MFVSADAWELWLFALYIVPQAKREHGNCRVFFGNRCNNICNCSFGSGCICFTRKKGGCSVLVDGIHLFGDAVKVVACRQGYKSTHCSILEGWVCIEYMSFMGCQFFVRVYIRKNGLVWRRDVLMYDFIGYSVVTCTTVDVSMWGGIRSSFLSRSMRISQDNHCTMCLNSVAEWSVHEEMGSHDNVHSYER